MRRMWYLSVLVLLAGCTMTPANGTDRDQDQGGAAAVRLSIDRSEYRAGDPIMLTLSNGTDQNIGYNLCTAALERRAGGNVWQAVPQPLVQACTMELRILQPGSRDTYRHTVPPGLQPGEYRLTTHIEAPLGGGSMSVASGSFQLR